jgi:outer membrane protein assembly factor BamB
MKGSTIRCSKDEDMKKALLLLIILLSLSYASKVWEFTTDGPISSKPLVYQGAVVVASDDGKIYALDPVNGAPPKWQATVGKTPNEPVMADNAIYVSTTKGKVFKLGTNGAVQWEANLNAAPYNASYVYGIGVNAKSVFVTAINGVYVLEKNGSVRSKISNFSDSVLTAPAAGPDYVIYGKGNELIRLSETGQVQWKATLSEGSFWLSRPVISGGSVYIGALDNRMHAYVVTNGLEAWEVRTRNWVLSTPLVAGDVYFGSNDGKVYGVDGGGGIKWTAQTQLAVQSQPESGAMGGRNVIFAGGTDRSIYAISSESGEIVWKGTSTGSVGSPLFYQNKVIFGSGDGKVYAYSTERACSITNPVEGDVFGLKELVVRGKYVSESGGAKVLIRINDGPWEDANTSEVDWVYYIDPKARLSPGLNIISCQVADSSGGETGPTFTSVSVTHDPGIPLSNLMVTVTPGILEGKNFTIFVNDGDDGSPVDRFNLSINEKNGRSYTADKNYTLYIAEAGTYQATVKKIGFNEAAVAITVNPSGVPITYIAGGVLLIIIVIWLVWSRFLRQRFAARRR